MRRRQFIQGIAAGAVIARLRPTGLLAAKPAPRVKIDEPFGGAVLNRRHGQQTAEGLKIQVRGTAPAEWRVTVNGIAAARSGQAFEATVMLRDRETVLAALARGDGSQDESRVRVVWDRHSFPRYRFSIDDNSFFLRDIAKRRYKSLFDCFYLEALRKLHRKYGTRFVLNIYYTTGKDFDLTQFPDRYKAEWKNNAGWLRLAFHARANEPARPYQDAEPKQLIADLDQVAKQIVRFAGEEVYTPPTVIHWGMVRPSAFKLLYRRACAERILPEERQRPVGHQLPAARQNLRVPLAPRCVEGLRIRHRLFPRGHRLQQCPCGQDRTPAETAYQGREHGRDHGSLHPRAVLLAVLCPPHPGPCPAP